MVHYYGLMPKRKLTQAQIDELVTRYTTRLPDGTWEGAMLLASDFGVRPQTIYRWLRLRGVEIRSARESHSAGKACKPVKNLPPGGIPPGTWRTSSPRVLALPGGPGCKCGCGEPVGWNRRKNRWNRYVTGHYRQAAPYKQEAWLREQYLDKRRTLAEIAAEHSVSIQTVFYYMDLLGVERRDLSDAHIGRQSGPNNPAWKGGVADWPYSPEWKRIARSIRQRDKWTCQDCGEQRKRWGVHLHVHHIDEDKFNNDPANLISLCHLCHRERHRNSNAA